MTDATGDQLLGRYEERWWPRDRTRPYEGTKAGPYRVFIPSRIAELDFQLDSAATSAVATATRALARVGRERPDLVAAGALARNLLRSESAASSRIEGVQASQRRLARAAYARDRGRGGDARAAEVLGNLEAMEQAIALGATSTPLSVDDVQAVHRTLLRFTDDADIAGVLRTSQNWIGGSDYHPLGAAYVGPPHEEVPGLLADLCMFMMRDDVAAVAQAAIVHAQYENIHPFADGNGRTGRALIYTVLRRRGEIGEHVVPISLALGAHPKDYVNGLGAYSVGRVSTWVARFAQATTRAAELSDVMGDEIAALQEEWLERLGQPRSDAASRQIVLSLPGQPVIDVAAAQAITSKSHVAVGNALTQLEAAGIVQPLPGKRVGRAWECGELLDLVDRFERSIATPDDGVDG